MKRIHKNESWWIQEVRKPGNERIATLEYPLLYFPGSKKGALSTLCPLFCSINRPCLEPHKFTEAFPIDWQIEETEPAEIIPVEISGRQNIQSIIRSSFADRRWGKNSGLLTLPEIEFVLGTDWVKPLEGDGCGDIHFFTKMPKPYYGGCDTAKITIETSRDKPPCLCCSDEAVDIRTQSHDFVFIRKTS